MALNNFEKDIKTKLNSREIQPSENAWQKLDALLDNAQNKETQKRKNLGWLSIAATLVTMISVFSIYVYNNSTNENNEVQNTNNGVVQSTKYENRTTKTELQSTKVEVQTTNLENRIAKTEHPKAKQTQLVQIPKTKIDKHQIIDIQHQNKNNDTPIVTNSNISIHEKPLDITSQETLTSNVDYKIQVNANDLLKSVDDKKEDSKNYSESIFTIVSRNAKNIGTAIINRNKQ